MNQSRRLGSPSNLARGMIFLGVALIVVGTVGINLGVFDFGSAGPAPLVVFAFFSPLLGLLAILIGVIGMLFYDVQKEHTDRLLGRLEELSNPETLKGDETPRINQVRP